MKAEIVDHDTIVIAGHALSGTEQVADVLRAALGSDPHFFLVIAPADKEYIKGIGAVIYASQRVGVPIENLRFTGENGELLTLDELRAQNPLPSP